MQAMIANLKTLTTRLGALSTREDPDDAGHVWVDTAEALAEALDEMRTSSLFACDCEGINLSKHAAPGALASPRATSRNRHMLCTHCLTESSLDTDARSRAHRHIVRKRGQ